MSELNLTITDIMHGDIPVLKIMKRDTQKWPTPYKDQYLTFKALEMGTFQFTKAVNYSINGGEWTALAAATDTPTLEPGDRIRWKATNTPNSTDGVGTFSSTGKYNAYGNPLSLRSGDNFKGVTTLPNNTYMFYKLFYQSSLLINAKDIALPFTTLRNSCYQSMFNVCTNLVSAPDLPAKTMTQYCYYGMFANCPNLSTAPEISATTLANYCFQAMFKNSGLIIAPELKVTTLANSCYYEMFYGCTSLTTPMAELPATTAKAACYQGMFYGCTSLTKMPIIKATTGASNCFNVMFRDCSSLTVTHDIPTTFTSSHANPAYGMFRGCTSMVNAPALLSPAFGASGYQYMFYGCTSLKYIKCLANGSVDSNTSYWVYQVPSGGTFVKHPNMTSWTTGVNGIPSGWTVEDAVLE